MSTPTKRKLDDIIPGTPGMIFTPDSKKTKTSTPSTASTIIDSPKSPENYSYIAFHRQQQIRQQEEEEEKLRKSLPDKAPPTVITDRRGKRIYHDDGNEVNTANFDPEKIYYIKDNEELLHPINNEDIPYSQVRKKLFRGGTQKKMRRTKKKSKRTPNQSRKK